MTLGTTCTGSRRCGCVGCYDARYAAGYAACRETMTPAVLATEDAYLLGHEAGRLAAIRADVLFAARQFEQQARDALDEAEATARYRAEGKAMQAPAIGARGVVDLWAKAADCRRWLEATR